MNKTNYNHERLEMDIKIKAMEHRIVDKTAEYHTSLLRLMKEEYEDGTERLKIFNELIDSFSYIVSINNSVISLSLDVARKQLEEAFDRIGMVKKDEK